MPRLESLVLTGNGLRSLPQSIGRLARLQSLECAGNKLTTLPTSIADLSQLTVLDVSGNYLSALPDNVGQLAKLKHLRASGNKLSAVLRRNLVALLRHHHRHRNGGISNAQTVKKAFEPAIGLDSIRLTFNPCRRDDGLALTASAFSRP